MIKNNQIKMSNMTQNICHVDDDCDLHLNQIYHFNNKDPQIINHKFHIVGVNRKNQNAHRIDCCKPS
jgi:hypothetical protein